MLYSKAHDKNLFITLNTYSVYLNLIVFMAEMR